MSFYASTDPDPTSPRSYDYDLIVIGGGSGGLACSKAAVAYGKKVCVLDYVKPSPHGSTWGLGGTCVNVGCIPKKHMHYAALLHEILEKDTRFYGYLPLAPKTPTDATPISPQKTHGLRNLPIKFQWETLVDSIQSNIKSTNFKYRVELREKKVIYENYLGTFIDSHTLQLTNELMNREPKTITGRRIVIGVGGRPQRLACLGGEHAISSDDLFSLSSPPERTLVIGGSYVALECAGFLASLGYPVTLMIRSIFLRGFDQEMANKIAEFMKAETDIEILFQKIPYRITKLASGEFEVEYANSDGRQVTMKNLTAADIAGKGTFDTILNATGRYADLDGLGLDKIGVQRAKNGHLVTKDEQTNVPHIYALGDCIEDVPELTPAAILAGKLLASRLYGNSHVRMDYNMIPTTIFTPIEYGCCGYSEENARKKYPNEKIRVFHQYFTPLEWSLSEKRPMKSNCYLKIICVYNGNGPLLTDSKQTYAENEMTVIGFHYLGPNAGEITQGLAVAIKMGVTYEQLIHTVGIHPTTAELMTMLTVTKESGGDPRPRGCCG